MFQEKTINRKIRMKLWRVSLVLQFKPMVARTSRALNTGAKRRAITGLADGYNEGQLEGIVREHNFLAASRRFGCFLLQELFLNATETLLV